MESCEVISTSAFGLIMQPYLRYPQRVTTKPGVRKRRMIVPILIVPVPPLPSPLPRTGGEGASTEPLIHELPHVAEALHLPHLFHRETDAERLLQRGDQAQMIHGV